MSQRPASPYAAVGLAAQMGCLMAVFALVALLVGLGLDRLVGTDKHWIALACVLVSIPINLFVALRLTQILIKRIIPPSSPPSGRPLSGGKADDEAE